MSTERFRVQRWVGSHLLAETTGVEHPHAIGLARGGASEGITMRLMSESRDYCEVYPPDRPVRRGTFAETTLVEVRP